MTENIAATAYWRDQQIMRLYRDPTYMCADHTHRLMILADDIRLDELPLKFRGSIVGAASAIARTKDIIALIKGSAVVALQSSVIVENAEDAASIVQWCDEILSYISPEDHKPESTI